MNHVYRTVFNRALGVWQAVAEIARGHGNAGGTKPVRQRWIALLPLAWASSGWAALPPVRTGTLTVAGNHATAAAAIPANRLPGGGTVSAGSGSIAQNGAAMTIAQQSQNLAINWQSFDIGENASVTFLQPNATAIALNRVLGANGSQILGQLKGNGQVWVLNPNGVLFGRTAQVDVGGLVASTLGLSDADFMAGKRTFAGNGGRVTNQGSLDGGYVALLGGQVRNEGTIAARLGTAALAAGNTVTLDFNGDALLNVQVDEGALHALADNRGLIQADGGTVLMTARTKDALLDTAVNNSGVIRARSVEHRNGRILLLGDMDNGAVNVAGTLDASAPDGGNGGFVETSAAHVKVADSATITTKSASGHNGKWLIDPVDFTVAASGGDMTGAALSSALGNGDVAIKSTDGASGVNGDVNIRDTVNWSRNTLTLDAQRNINVYSVMNGSGTAGLFFKYGQADGGGSYNIFAPVNLASTGSFQTQSGSARAVTDWTIITSLGDEGSTSKKDLQGINGNLSGNYVLGADIDASVAAAWENGKGFHPLGDRNINENGFTGNFDGLGHVIDGLTINNPDTYSSESGLFATATNASFANVGLTNVSIQGGNSAGGLVDRSGYVTIRNSYVTGSVSASASAGGILGRDIFPRGSSSLINVYSTADVTATNAGTGTAIQTGVAGGLVGANVNLVENSYSTGKVTGGNYVGGLVGYANEATIQNSYFAGTVTVNGTGYTSGAILGGRVSEAPSLYNVLTNVYWNTDLVGTTLTANGNSSLATLTNVAGLTTAQMHNPTNWAGFTFSNSVNGGAWTIADGAMPMLTSEWSSYIRNAHQLQLMNLGLSAAYTLANDIDASATNGATGDLWYGGSFSPIGNTATKFTGSFDGQGHTIDGLTIDRAAQDNIGLFGYTSNATLQNVTLADADITGHYFVGALLGRSTGTNLIDNAASSGTVASTGTSNSAIGTGGLAGLFNGTMSNSHSSAAVTGYAGIGGLLGVLGDSPTNGHRITESWASGDVTATSGAGGGLVGYSRGRLDHVHATGNVNGGQYLGGLVGVATQPTYWTDAGLVNQINVTYATGDVTGSGDRIGGLVGSMEGSTDIGSSFAAGNVVGHNAVGGLIGYMTGSGNSIFTADVNGSYTLGGTVTGNDYVGGLVGQIEGYTRLMRSYVASGTLTGTAVNAKVGGVVGWQQVNGDRITIDSVVWNTETTGTTHMAGADFTESPYAVGATTADMMTLRPYELAGFYGAGNNGYTILTDSTAAGRSFDENTDEGRLYNLFRLYEGKTYPLLMAFLTTATVGADLSGNNKTYDGQIASGTVGHYTTDIAVDTRKILGTLSYATHSANAGTYSTGNGLDISGGLYSDQFGYNILYNPDAASLTINKASLTLGTNDVTKTYDGTLDAHGHAIVIGGQLYGDDEISGGHFAFTNKNAGTGKTVTVSGVAVDDGNGGDNYAIHYVDNTHSTIDPKAITVAGSFQAADKPYDGRRDASISRDALALQGVLADDTLAADWQASFADATVGTGKTVTLAGSTLTGTDSGNYQLDLTGAPTSIATITPLPDGGAGGNTGGGGGTTPGGNGGGSPGDNGGGSPGDNGSGNGGGGSGGGSSGGGSQDGDDDAPQGMRDPRFIAARTYAHIGDQWQRTHDARTHAAAPDIAIQQCGQRLPDQPAKDCR